MFEIFKLIINVLTLLFNIVKFIYEEHLIKKLKKYISLKRNHKEKK